MDKSKEVKPLDIVLLGSKKGFVPKAIRLFRKSTYNHAGIVAEYLGELYIVEAQERGFHPTKTVEEWIKEKKEKGDKVVFLRASKPFDLNLGYSRLKSMVGAGYEFFNLTFYQVIKALTGKWYGTKDSKRVICSEAVAWVYEEYFEEPFSTTPDEIYENPDFTEVLKFG